MDLAKQLELHLENEPALFGQKLMLIRAMIHQPVTAAVAEERFYDWAVEGMEFLMNELDLDPQDIEMSVCREVARTYAKVEPKKIEAGAYKELDIMMREALESGLRPDTRVQIRMDGKEGSGKLGTIMQNDLSEMLPTDLLANDDEVAVRLDDNQVIEVALNRLDVVEASTMFVEGADLLKKSEI